jgi:hypothetical protein
MTKQELLAFLRSHKYAVQASVSTDLAPQAALVGFAVTEQLEIIFDTLESTRKVANLKANFRIALVIGGWLDGDERTVQYEGEADFPTGEELKRLKKVYFAAFPDGPARQAWPGIAYVRTKPLWVRFSNFNVSPPEVFEFSFLNDRSASALDCTTSPREPSRAGGSGLGSR